ncbi:Glycoside hydrolase [Cordyceps militaris CM01]|uniref:Glycoside hydrolase n=1 Tax=Cordyceps militaris (strain CM01) TaxID=983644 RepID=G3JED2_CORMM|nr:Glycoside hydrolase [Cordyceps militaris CM01]EGX93383.1 Glycoside hydrolase [Cordyceps militaris CM01]
MFSKVAVALPLAASLLEQVNAFSFHRHQHAAEKRDNVVWHTVYTTVYVTAGVDDAPAQTAQAFVQDSKPSAAPPAVTVVPSQPPAAAPPAQTTLSTAVKPVITQASIPSGAVVSSKQGIAYNDVSMANAFKQGCSAKGCKWAYNWGSSAPGLDSSVQYIPMLWGDLPVHTSHWDADAEAAIANGAKALLSFNEPDMPSQANMDAGAAAAAHAKYFSKYKGRAQIGSPAVSNSGQAGQGVAWLKSFVSACNANSDCHFDFCAVHWYSEAQYADTLFDHLKAATEACDNKPVWLTEFAPFGSDDQISSFMTTVLPKLESLDYLHAYSYFMVAQNQLMSSSTALSTIGKVYAAIAN